MVNEDRTKVMSDEENLSDSLDPLSSNFDPLAALYSNDVPLPVPDAPTYDNIGKYEQAASGVVNKPKPKKVSLRLVKTFKNL